MSVEFEKAQELLGKLIAFDTTSRNSNLELIHFIEGYLGEKGIPSVLVHNDEGSKANIIATIGPNTAGGVVLSGHTDVVPVDDQDWDTDPFVMTEHAGKLFGRGTSDMKGFIAVCLAYAEKFKTANLVKPVHFAFSYDEEVGCLGIQAMLPVLKEHVAQPRLVVVGEPTSMAVANAHKGQHVSRTKVHGREAHSSRAEDGVNAVMVAADLIKFIEGMAETARNNGHKDDMFDPPYTSFNVGPIAGGSAFNIIPNYCEFDWEFRAVPADNGKEHLAKYEAYIHDVVNPKISAKFPECYAETSVWAYLPPLKAYPGDDAETLALALAEKNATTVLAFGTEGGHFQSIEFPAVVCGPGDIAQAHKPNEFIEKSQLEACGRFMERLIEALK
ncbi:acetylornithine deacetylase [Kordiimonas laminariae]|uniref:acetylornithine deacetylase n=1 Tax=Kordiimonas laminariae TaxID=2917717 RepID=UPI001FF3A367|nr:acetylornithine deacetylase [Kordiimonas laminariae]MCK0069526.1 acetylornithine deacetylase [Kordiimonas laminariae]